jgi:hypothetical protein
MTGHVRNEWVDLVRSGLCPECKQAECVPMCRKYWFEYGWRRGYHDGANNMADCSDGAFVNEMVLSGEYDES